MTASTGRYRRRRDARIDLTEVESLLHAGESPWKIAQMLGVQPRSIQRVAHNLPADDRLRVAVLAEFRGQLGRTQPRATRGATR